VYDEVASCNEHDPYGAIEYRAVEDLFVTTGRIWHVQVNGRTIRTTAEHPFYVWDKGWTAAHGLQAGDRLRSDDGQTVTVEAVCDSGVVETVYNCRVAEYHTYFVGSREWGFSVWAHNTCVYTSKDPITGKVNYVGIIDNPAARFAAQRRSGLGVNPEAVSGLESLTRAEARAVEQVLIEQYGLGKNGGSLLNKINSIAPANPIYASAKTTGTNILHKLGLFGF
jgi:hypothetical protein